MGTEKAGQRRELTKPVPQLKNNSWICIFSVSASKTDCVRKRTPDLLAKHWEQQQMHIVHKYTPTMFQSKWNAPFHLQFGHNLIIIIISFLKPKVLFFWRRKSVKNQIEEQPCDI